MNPVMRKVNIQETIRIHAIVNGQYHNYLKAYDKHPSGRYANPKFHEYYEERVLYQLSELLGDRLGENPHNIDNPLRIELDRMYGRIK